MEHEPDPVANRLREVGEALDAVGMIGGSRLMASYALLALLGLRPDTVWSGATNPLMRNSPILNFANEHYGSTYAANTRETFRKHGVHPLIAAGLIVKNPDKPRPINSPNTCYQITDDALMLFKRFGRPNWDEHVRVFLTSYETLGDQFAHRRRIDAVPLRRNLPIPLSLSAGEHSDLIELIIREFGPRFTPNGILSYAGDTGRKWAYFDEEQLLRIGVEIEDAGEKMPDILIVFPSGSGDWLVAVEAYHSGGEIDVVRRSQLRTLFAGSSLPLVLVTAFADRATMGSRAKHIAWETDAWVAEHPDHLIHYDGQHLLQRYESTVTAEIKSSPDPPIGK